MFLKLFNSAGVRNVHLHCGNDQAVQTACRQGVAKVDCSMLWHQEGCSPCLCSAILTFQDIKKIEIAHRDLLGKPLAVWKCCFATRSAKTIFLSKKAAHQISPQHRPLHHSIAGWLCQEKQQPGVKPSCRTQHPFLPRGQHFSLWKWSSALIQHFCCLFYFCTSN